MSVIGSRVRSALHSTVPVGVQVRECVRCQLLIGEWLALSLAVCCLRHVTTNHLQILAAANREALAVAAASGLQFIRAEGFVFSHVADEGWMDACAGPLLRYRKSIGMEDKVAVVCDIKKKHSAHAVTGDVDIVETAKAARFFRSDGVIVTGASTGHEASPGELQAVLAGVPDLPVLVGSGVSAANLKSYRSLKTNTKEFSKYK